MPYATRYAIASTDAQQRVWFLSKSSALHGSMIRTSDPIDSLSFGSHTELDAWLLQLPERWRQQLEGRDLEVRPLMIEVGVVTHTILLEPLPTAANPGAASVVPQATGGDSVPSPAPADSDPPVDAPQPRRAARKAKAAHQATPLLDAIAADSGPAVAVLDAPADELAAAPAGDDDDEPDFVPKPLGGMSWFKPSTQQQPFLDALKTGTSHLLLEARAGSGKSTTCKAGAWALHEAGRSSVYACFNSAIAQEFRGDLPKSCSAATLHSLGFKILRDEVGGTVTVDPDKVDRLLDAFFDPKRRDRNGHRRTAKQLVGLCKNLLLTDLDDETLLDVASTYGVEFAYFDQQQDVFAVVPALLRKCQEDVAVIDYDDMIWLPVTLGLQSRESPDVLFVDEAQDLNACQHALVDLICPAGRMVVVGDRWQSIYRFRGADSDSIPRFEQKLTDSSRGLETYPLTVSRRCPKRHVEMARRIVSDLDHLTDAIDGRIEQVHEEKWQKEVEPGDLVLCRTNAPLVSACYRLLKSGTPATIRGRDIGTGLRTLILRMKAGDPGELMRRLGDYRAEEVAKLSKVRNPEPKLAALHDKVDCLIALCDGAKTVAEVEERATSFFTDKTEEDTVQLSSVHRAKGLERPRVVVLRPDLMPGPWAKGPEDQQQELNLTYVAATRAKEALVFVGEIPQPLRARA